MSQNFSGQDQNAETRLFVSLTPDRILDAAESTGLKCSGRCLQLNSLENRVFEIELELTQEQEQNLTSKYDPYRVLKFYRPGRWTADQIREEHEFIEDLQKEEIPVAGPVNPASEGSVRELREEKIWFTIFPKVGGRIEYETSDSRLASLGRLLARLHATGARKNARHRLKLTPETFGINNLTWLMSQDLLPLDLRSRYQRAVEEIVSLCEPLFSQIPLQRIHGDCHLGNVLWNGDQPLWVDFDDMVQGPRVQDIWLLVPNRDEEGLRQREIFLKAYESMSHFDRETLRLTEPLRALRYIHYSCWIARRWEDPAFKRAFPDFNSWQYWATQTSDMEEQLDLTRKEFL